MKERVDVTIIGGGPVGLFGAFYAGMRGMSVRIIDSLPELGGQLMALYPEKFVYDMPGFPEVLAKDLANALIKQSERFSPELAIGQTAETLTKDDDGYLITTSTGEQLPTRTVVVSAGNGAFSPTRVGVEREDEFVGKGITYGVQNKAALTGKKVFIVGGGDSAFDWALNLHGTASEIAIVHRRDEFRAHEETVKQVKELGVEFLLWKQVTELHGSDHLEAVTLTDSQTKETARYEIDSLVVNIGFKSSLGPLKDWGMTITKNQIEVDEHYQTCLPGVFAVGDVCTFDGKLKLIATGVGEAATAVCIAKTMIDPNAKLFPGHSSDMKI